MAGADPGVHPGLSDGISQGRQQASMCGGARRGAIPEHPAVRRRGGVRDDLGMVAILELHVPGVLEAAGTNQC